MQHRLSLEVIETLQECSLKIVDTSIYAEGLPVDCQLLQITLPGFTQSIDFDEERLPTGFNLNLSNCELSLTEKPEDCSERKAPLQDGVYVIRYSVSPNDQVYVEYNHLRITKALNCYYKALCELDLGACEPDSEIEKKLKLLGKAKLYLDAAKSKVEICHDPIKGADLYTYAVKLLSKFGCNECQSC